MRWFIILGTLALLAQGRPDKPLGRRGRRLGRGRGRLGKQLETGYSSADTGYGAPPPPPPVPTVVESREAEAAYGAPKEAETEYGAPREAEAGYGAPEEGYGAPLSDDYPTDYSYDDEYIVDAKSDELASYGAPESSYGAPREAEDAYGAPPAREAEEGYGAPPAREAEEGYGAPPAEEEILDDDYYVDAVIDLRGDELSNYAEEPLDNYNDLNSAASDLDAKSADGGLDMLMKSVPGIPGEDYPIYPEAPETAFSCEGQVNGGYYADPEAECQVFHICTDDGAGNLAKYSFLCPNGTIFNQNYFICDWWFNVDCSEAEALAEAKNSELVSAREAAAELAGEESAPSGYGAPAEYGVPTTAAPVVEAKEAVGGYGAPAEYAEYSEYDAAATNRDYANYEEPLSTYGQQ